MNMAATIRTALGRMGFSTEVAHYITTDQQLDNLEEFHPLMNAEIKSFIKVV